MKIVLAIENQDLRPEAAWLLHTLFADVAPEVTLGVTDYGGDLSAVVDDQTVLLTWGEAQPDVARLPRRPAVVIHVAADSAFHRSRRTPEATPAELAFEGLSALTFYHQNLQDEGVRAEGQRRWRLSGDVLATVFSVLARLEEWENGPRDQFDRYDEKHGYLMRYGLATRPVVDEVRALLDRLIEHAWTPVPRRSLWNGRRAAMFLGHDVDHVRYSTPKGLLKHPWRTARLTGRWREGWRSLRQVLWGFSHRRSDPYFSYYYLLRLYRHLHIRGTFFVIPRRTHRLEPYDLLSEDDLIRALTALAVRVNAEIGLHASFAGGRGGAEFERDLAAFHKAFAYGPDGMRSHYLRFFWPDTPRALEAAGVHYDSTLGFSAIEGFRCGTSRPFFLFDVERRRPTNVLEIPLLLMDSTLMYHRRYSTEEAMEKSLALLRTVHTYNGVFTLLWHTEALLCPLWTPWRRGVLLPLLREGLRASSGFLTGEQINLRCRAMYHPMPENL
ncbi:MAG: hypothetical protein Kow0059_04410 [Candidatus Sumerlaeia bacterium]